MNFRIAKGTAKISNGLADICAHIEYERAIVREEACHVDKGLVTNTSYASDAVSHPAQELPDRPLPWHKRG